MKPKVARKYHTLLYETITKISKDGFHKVTKNIIRIADIEKVEINDIIHDIFIYIVNNDNLYQRCENIIEVGGNINGFIFRIMENFLLRRFKNSTKEEKRTTRWSELITNVEDIKFSERKTSAIFKSKSFKKEDTFSSLGFSDQEQIDMISFENGFFAPSAEDIYIKYEDMIRLNEPERTILKLFFEGKNYRQVSEIIGIPISTISRKMKKLKLFLE